MASVDFGELGLDPFPWTRRRGRGGRKQRSKRVARPGVFALESRWRFLYRSRI